MITGAHGIWGSREEAPVDMSGLGKVKAGAVFTEKPSLRKEEKFKFAVTLLHFLFKYLKNIINITRPLSQFM